jgi:hypothetical protein
MIRALRTAVIQQLITANTAAGSRVYTPPVKPGTEPPYLVVSGYGETPVPHYAAPGAHEMGCNIQGVARVTSGDALLLTLYEQVRDALQDVPLAPAGQVVTWGNVRFVVDYPEPSDTGLRLFVCRYEATGAAS